MIDLKFTSIATDKYQLYTNGINKALTNFFDSLRDETVKITNLLKIKTINFDNHKIDVFHKEISANDKTLLVLLLKSKRDLIVADIILQSEYDKIFT